MYRNVLVFGSIFLSLMITAFTWAEPIRLSEPVETDHNSETFGQQFDTSGNMIDLATLVDRADLYLGKQMLITASIAKVCQKKGCFFIAQQDQHALRVAFKDYGFFIPTDSSGKTIVLSGELIEKNVTTKQAEHFKADLNSDSAVLNTGKVYEIVASGIKIPRG